MNIWTQPKSSVKQTRRLFGVETKKVQNTIEWTIKDRQLEIKYR